MVWEEHGCGLLSISGCEDAQPEAMTDYEQVDEICGGRPMYESSNGFILWFHLGWESWSISLGGCVSSSFSVFSGSSTSPLTAVGWECRNDINFDEYDLSVVCERFDGEWQLISATKSQVSVVGTGVEPFSPSDADGDWILTYIDEAEGGLSAGDPSGLQNFPRNLPGNSH